MNVKAGPAVETEGSRESCFAQSVAVITVNAILYTLALLAPMHSIWPHICHGVDVTIARALLEYNAD